MARNPYEALTDRQVFDKARDALLERARLPQCSSGYAFYSEIYDSAMLELGWRAVRAAITPAEADE